jgi:predicted GIY-YIG superfamily endonuclease
VARNGKPLQAGHYIGWTDDLVGRILEHTEGKGARFTQVCVERGISFALARIWDGDQADRKFERRLKNWKAAPKLCPICNAETALHYMQLERRNSSPSELGRAEA